MVARQIATKATPVVDIDQTGDQFVVRTVSGPFTPDEVFTVGQHNVLQQPDGSKIKVGFYNVLLVTRGGYRVLAKWYAFCRLLRLKSG